MPPVFGKEMIKTFIIEGHFNLGILSGADFYLSGRMMQKEKKEFYFTTRDLIMMAAFAAVGGIASTYINMIGDLFQSFLGFAGTTQWAAGLHVVWLMLAAVIIKKPGAASTAGILKGAVEFFSGNTHGLFVVIVDILAGVLIDLIFLANRKGSFNIWFYIAAGISSASNIFVFQIFASIPSDILTILVIGAAASGAFISGIIFGGILVRSIYLAVQKAGLVPIKEKEHSRKRAWPPIIIVISLIIMIVLGLIYNTQHGTDQSISISGNVNNPYEITLNDLNSNTVEISAALNDVERTYQGVRITDILERSQLISEEGLLLIKANDGYSYFITIEEIYSNENLILTSQEVGKTVIVNVVGAISQKAWIRGVSELIVTDKNPGIEISGDVKTSYTFYPQDWQGDMDSFYINLETGSKKLQGIPLQNIIDRSSPTESNYQIEFITLDGDDFSLSSQELSQQKDHIRIFVLATESGVQFILGNIDGLVLGKNIFKIDIN